jgi:tetratricopeptide (TPR) repeat protein
MSFDVTDPAYKDLVSRVVRSGDEVVPFVGAGLSVYGRPADRLPLWGELLEDLVDEGRRRGLIPPPGDPEIDEAIDNERFIEAADRLLRALGEPVFRRTVEKRLDDKGKPMPPAISQLLGVDWSLIVTTNLDRLIGRAYLEQHKRPITTITGNETRRLAQAVAGMAESPETVLAQIHGSVDVYESWRLTESHYELLLQDDGYVLAMQSLFLRRLLFIGFGLKDDDFATLLQTIAHIYPPGVGEFYVLLPHSRKNDQSFLELMRQCELRPIYYDIDESSGSTDPFGGHRAVFECLEHLASQWAATRTDLEVTVKYFPELDPNLVEREKEIRQLLDLILTGRQVVQVVGMGGLGKTSLVLQLVREYEAELGTSVETVFGCSLYRADISQFINDMALATVKPESQSIPHRVDLICEYVRTRRTLLILDGLETVLDEEGGLRSPYLLQIIEAVTAGEGSVLVTSRIPAVGRAFEAAHVIEVVPFSSGEILAFLRRWGLDRLGETANERLIAVTAGHPLALRIVAGLLQDAPPNEAIGTIERSSVIDVADEVDPLRENRLARVIGSYFRYLSESEIAFLDCLSIFEKPTPFALVDAAITREYPDTEVNGPLLGRDLRPVVGRLLDRRLLISSPVGELSCHPTVREYFGKHAVQEEAMSLAPIHRYVAAEALRDAPRQPDTFEQATPLIDACRHAAKSRDWTLFDDLFRQRLMRGFWDYLCDTLGAWEETLTLASLGDTEEFPAEMTGQPGYYPTTVARCLKHLGRTSESRAKYLRTLREVASTRDPETARYVNNFLTLLVWRGELGNADLLVELNIRALSWIDGSWKYCWQDEQGFSSIAYLKLLQGQLEEAERLFDHSERAWDDFHGESPWIADYYAFHRSELTLLREPDAHDRALANIDAILAEADVDVWPEVLCRGLIQGAVVRIDRGIRNADRGELETAVQSLETAQATTAGMNVADVAIAHNLTRLKVELARNEIAGRPDLETAELGALVDRTSILVSTSGLALAQPEVMAARGAIAYLEGSWDSAKELYLRATRQCVRHGNAWAPTSPRSLVGWLGKQLGRAPGAAPAEPSADLLGLVGEPLEPDWMVGRLEVLGRFRQTESSVA